MRVKHERIMVQFTQLELCVSFLY